MPKNETVAIVPAYNAAPKELEGTIRSLLEQTLPVDICLIDDGSIDPLISPFPDDDRITIVRCKNNGGITKALLVGLENCNLKGYKYALRLDVGDYCERQRAAKQIDYLERHPEINILGARARVTDLQGNFMFVHGIAESVESVKRYLWSNSPFKHSTFAIRLSALNDMGSYCLDFNGAEDYELLLRHAKNNAVDCLSDVLVTYVEDPSGISSTRRWSQLKKRLKAQLKHSSFTTIHWYVGVGRTIVTMMLPRVICRWVTVRAWA